ncbi:MAG: hypothetical protein K2J11_07935 [Oscillospiraceae bacterium]|nr:hypothetical protein [Oscillospiraceae bacterium]
MKFKRYSDYPPKIRRYAIIQDIIKASVILTPVIAVILSLCGLNAAADIIKAVYLTAIFVGVLALSVAVTVRAFREKRIGTGIFLALMSLTIPTVILLAVTEKGRALVLYILEGY